MPDEAECYAGLLTLPDLGPVAVMLVGYNGDVPEGERCFAPVRAFGKPLLDAIGPMTHRERQAFIDEGNVEHGVPRYWKSGYAESLPDEFLDAAIAAARTFTSPESSILFFRVHGACTRVRDDATAFALRREKWDFNVIAQWRDPAEAETHKAWARALWSALEPLTLGAAYVNHLAADDSGEKLRASFGANYARLAQLKAEYDPDNAFCFNPNIPPVR
jgi:FAD/FMN-containing dehydrogenase